jgi:hypothetical protein
MEKAKRTFIPLNPPTTGKGAKLYADYKAAQGIAAAKAEAFNAWVAGQLDSKGLVPAGKAVNVSHMFGKLSYELVDATAARAAKAKAIPVDLG